ncbi:MAG: YfiR family protein [Planctomycetes bacterium]|nr:YfiR family protein [Planctomycetota bacterium]
MARDSSQRAHRRPAALWAALALALAHAQARPEEPRSAERAIKAAFLFNFTKFVEWPASAFGDAKAPFVIAVLGEDLFGELLEAAVKGKVVKGRPITIRRYTEVKELGPAHVLFVSSSLAGQLAEVFEATKKLPVLTVSDMPGFIQRQGAIEFVIADGRVKLHVNFDNAAAAGLKLSAELLKVSKVFRTDRAGEK